VSPSCLPPASQCVCADGDSSESPQSHTVLTAQEPSECTLKTPPPPTHTSTACGSFRTMDWCAQCVPSTHISIMGLDDELFNMKFTAKQLSKEAKKLEKEEKKALKAVALAIKQSNAEGAKIHADTAIRWKNQSMQFLRMSSRVEAISKRLEMAIRMNQVSKSMGSVAKAMKSSLGTMNLEKIGTSMDAFEKAFDDVNVSSAYVEDIMDGQTAAMAPQSEVESLIQRVADENDLEVRAVLPDAAPRELPEQASSEADDIEKRLAALRG